MAVCDWPCLHLSAYSGIPDRRDTLCKSCRYYINKTKKPKNRASIRLAVKIGSILEEEHERGTQQALCTVGTVVL